MSERPEIDELQGATGWHSRIRYAFARQGAAGKRVLDIACGNGFGTVHLAEVAASVVGVDASASAVATARSAFARPNVRYEHVGKAPLPFGEGAFDLVVCLETLEHMRGEEQGAFLADLRRMLAPDGVLVLSTPDHASERRYELATGAFNPWHLHTPLEEELSSLLSPFPNRMILREVDLIVTVAGVGSSALPDLEVALGVEPTPISVIHVCAQNERALGAFRSLPCGFRDEPRLSAIAEALDARPQRLRWMPGEDQALRIAAGIGALRPGTSAWWKRQAIYALAARFAAGRLALDVGCVLGAGAARLASLGTRVVATAPPGVALEAARSILGGPCLQFLAAESLLPAGTQVFDVITCLAPEADPSGTDRATLLARAFERLAPDGVLISDRALPGVPSVELFAADVVATAVISKGGAAELSDATAEGQSAIPMARTAFYAASHSPESLARIRGMRPVALVRGDFQWEALAMEIFFAARTRDLAGFIPDQRDELLALRLARMEEQMEDTLARMNRRLDIAFQHRPLFSVRFLLNQIRRVITRAR